MNNCNYTTYEQSKRLVELGLNIETADGWYKEVYEAQRSENGQFLHYKEKPSYIVRTLYKDWESNFSENMWKYVPYWSLGTLIELMKPINGNTYSITGTLDGSAFVEFEGVTTVAFHEETTFDSVYEMVCWLLENNYITKNNNNEENSIQR